MMETLTFIGAVILGTIAGNLLGAGVWWLYEIWEQRRYERIKAEVDAEMAARRAEWLRAEQEGGEA